jgi:DNA-binding MarR family transcriptional regulator
VKTVLKPTPERIALMCSVEDGHVWEDWFSDEPGRIVRKVAARDVTVTGKVRVLKTAGLCETSSDDDDLHGRRIVVTAAGREWLARAEQESNR